MKRNGFTLIELLATIIILALIGLIVYPTLNNVIQGNKEKLYNKQIEELIRHANTWAAGNSETLAGKYTYKLTFDELHKYGLLQNSTVKNPKTNQDLQGCMILTKSERGYDIAYSEECNLKQVTITYMDGDTIYGTFNYEYGTEIPIIDNTRQVDGYTFAGWDTKSAATDVAYTPGSKLTLTGNTILYAVWNSGISITVTRVSINGNVSNTIAEPGDDIMWNITVTNDSDIEKVVTLTEQLIGASFLEGNTITVPAGATKTVTVVYTVKTANKGSVVFNTISATVGDTTFTVTDSGTQIVS